MLDISTGQSIQVAQHEDAIKCIQFLNQGNIIATGSWDKTIKYWDTRSPQPIATVQLPERCYSMDAKGSLLVVGTAEKHICVFDLNNPTVIFKVSIRKVNKGQVWTCWHICMRSNQHLRWDGRHVLSNAILIARDMLWDLLREGLVFSI